MITWAAVKTVIVYVAKLAMSAGKAALVIGKGVAITSAKAVSGLFKILKAHPELAKAIANGVITSVIVDEVKTKLAENGVPTDQAEAYLEWLRGEGNVKAIEGIQANALSLSKQSAKGGLQKSGNHPSFWAPKDAKVNTLKQVYSDVPAESLILAMANKHYTFRFPKWGFDSSLLEDPLKASIQAYYSSILKYSPDYSITQRTLEENMNALKAVMMNSVSLHALLKQIKRSQDSADLIIQDSEVAGKKVRPFYRRLNGATTPTGAGLPTIEGFTGVSMEPTAIGNLETIDAKLRFDTIPDTNYVDALSELTISNAVWDRIISSVTGVIYESDSMKQYIDWLLDGGFINTPTTGSASEILTFYYDCPVYYMNVREGGTYFTMNYPFFEGGFWKPSSLDDLKNTIKYTVQTQRDIITNYPAIGLLLHVMGLKLQTPKDHDGKVQNIKWEVPKTLITDSVQPFWAYTRRDPLAKSYRLHKLSFNDKIALENAVIVADTVGNFIMDREEGNNTPVTERTTRIYRTVSTAATSLASAGDMCAEISLLRRDIAEQSSEDETDLFYWRDKLGEVLDKYDNRAIAIPRSNDDFLMAPHKDVVRMQKEVNNGSYDLGVLRSHIKWGGAYYLVFKGVTVSSTPSQVSIDAGVDRTVPNWFGAYDYNTSLPSLRAATVSATHTLADQEVEALAHNSLYPTPIPKTVAYPVWYECTTSLRDNNDAPGNMELAKGVLTIHSAYCSDEDTQFLLLNTRDGNKAACRALGYYHLFIGDQAFAKMAITGNAVTEYYQTST